jgi:hypothetical protein
MPEAIVQKGMGLTLQGEIGGVSLALEQFIDASSDEATVNDTLDLMTRAWHRQRAKSSLRALLTDVRRQKIVLDSLPAEKTQLAKDRAADKARLIASWGAAHQISGKRGDFRPSQSQRQNLETHDLETVAKLAEIDKKIADNERMIPVLEEEMGRLRRQIAGEDPIDETEAEEPLPLAAE